MSVEVNAKVTPFDQGLRGVADGGRAAQRSANAGQQFATAERLGDVVIGSGIQRLDLAALLAANREHDDRDLRNFAELAAQLDAVHVRHSEVGDHQVGDEVLHDFERGFTVVGHANLIALGAEAGAQDPRNLRLVVDNQYVQSSVH